MLAENLDYYADHDLENNYRSLALVVYEPTITPEHALFRIAQIKRYDRSEKFSIGKGRRYSDADIAEMARLRAEGKDGNPMAYESIGDLYGCSADSIYHTLKRHGKFVKGFIGKGSRE